MTGFLKVLIDFISEPAILVGIMVLIGMILQKKPISDIIKATLKATLGFVVISASAGVIVSALNPIGAMFEKAFNITGVVPNNEAIVAVAILDFGTATALIMAVGMIFNILIAKFTKFKYIFLTGHHTLFMACMVAVIMSSTDMGMAQMVFTGALALGLMMVIFPALCHPFMNKITGTDSVALGHFSSTGYVLAALIGKAVGKGSKSTEEIKVPQSLSFLRDSSVSITITMLVLYITLALASGAEFVETTLSGGDNFLVFAIMQSFMFAAGFVLIQNGVRLVLNEIVPAFKGIATKLVKDAKPALDCPIVFTYAPNAVIIGFISSFIGGFISMFVLGALGLVIIIPGVIPHFFCGATAGVFANATGGRRGAIIGSFINGIVISFLPVLLLPIMGNIGFTGSTFGDADFAISGIFLGKVSEFFGSTGLTITLVAITAGLVVYSMLTKEKAVEQELPKAVGEN